MIYTITAPPSVRASIQLPASKSISNRVLILNALSGSPYPIENLSASDDTRAMLNAFEPGKISIDIGAAGTAMRFLTSYFSQCPGEYLLTGTERMKNRPIRILTDALRQLGAEIDYVEKEGYPPLKIKGKTLKGGTIRLDGQVSSQYISALMMIAPCLKEGLTLLLEGRIVSRPYINMTARLMQEFGVHADWNDSVIRIAPQSYKPKPFRVESDWSAASYWYEIEALSGSDTSIELLGLEQDSVQGDSEVARLFALLNKGATKLNHDFVDIPDLAQTMVVTCCMLNIPFRFTGLQSLRIKETDRIAALQQEMKKLGYILTDEADSIIEWQGERVPAESNPVISTYEDHRMAMAFAPVCLKNRHIRIKDPEVVSKSYPGYWKDLKKAGFVVSEDNIIIREILETDNKSLAEMIRKVFEEYDAPKQCTVYSDSSTDNLFRLFRKTKSILWVLVVAGNVEGCCGIYPTEGLEENCAELVKFYLNKNARGQGFGKQLMEKSIESARLLGYKYLYLESLPQFAKAVRIYEKQGFKKLEHPLGNSGHSACTVRMIKEIG